MGIYEIEKYFAVASDPIHIGTGGYRIGRVDNTIVREPSTNLPKIPGTTIEGATRNYAYLKAKENKEDVKLGCAKGKIIDEDKTNKNEQPCGKCSICSTFGYSINNDSLHALSHFSDTQILFFPVATMIGPVWVTCQMVLNDAGIIINKDEIKISSNEKFISNIDKLPERKDKKNILNLGWVLLEKDNGIINPSSWTYSQNNIQSSLSLLPKDILSRIVVVHDTIFSQIVNMNLEVRTSVAIDPIRGAAEEGALFTYEAIPRSTVFWFEVVFQNPENFPGLSNKTLSTNSIKGTVEAGLHLMQFLGIGGMSTRGFGKIKVLIKESSKAVGVVLK